MHITAIIPCKNRLAHLKKGLPTVLNQIIPDWIDLDIVVVDYGCTEGTQDYTNQFKDVMCLSVPNKPWNLSASRNAWPRIAVPSEGAYLFLDADNLLSPYFIAENIKKLEDGTFVTGWGAGATGTMLCFARDFHAADGYNELCEGWGMDDIHMYWKFEKLYSMERRTFLPGTIACIPHGDEVRQMFHTENKEVTNARNAELRHWKGLSEKTTEITWL